MTPERLSIVSVAIAILAVAVSLGQAAISQISRDDFLRADLNARLVDQCASFSQHATRLLYTSTAEAKNQGRTRDLADLHGQAVAIDILARSLTDGGREAAGPNYLTEYTGFAVFADISTAQSVEQAVTNLAERVLKNCAVGFSGIETV